MNTFFRRLGYLRYLSKPALWPEIARRVKQKLFHTVVDETEQIRQREESTQWCEQNAVSTSEFLSTLSSNTQTVFQVGLEFPDIHETALQKAKESPVKMGGAGNLDLLYTLCEFLQAKSVLETGVAYGWSSLAILLSLQKRTGSRLYSVDMPYLELHNDRWVGIVVPESLRHQWTLIRKADREGIPQAIQLGRTFDFIHYDSDKSYEGRHWAYQQMWSVLREGGILVSDDINDNLAFRDFCHAIQLHPFIIAFENKYQGILVKKS